MAEAWLPTGTFTPDTLPPPLAPDSVSFCPSFVWSYATSVWFILSKPRGRLWPLPSGSLLGAPVHWRFHYGLWDDSSCLLCPASMEATKPQERKRTVLRIEALAVQQPLPRLWGLCSTITGFSPVPDKNVQLYLWATVWQFLLFIIVIWPFHQKYATAPQSCSRGLFP